MGKKSIISIEAVIDFIENHLDGKLGIRNSCRGCPLFKISLAPIIHLKP